MSKGSHRNNNKNRKGKGNDSKPNQTTNAKQELKFAPVGRNGNFALLNDKLTCCIALSCMASYSYPMHLVMVFLTLKK